MTLTQRSTEDSPVTQVMSLQDYHAETDHDSHSSLEMFHASPALYYETRVTGRIQRKETDATRLGHAVHAAILHPDRVGSLIKCIPAEVLAKNGARSTKAFKAFAEEHKECTLLKQDEYDLLRWQVDNVVNHPIASKHLGRATDFELSCFFHDDDAPLKCRFDALDSLGCSFLDLKSTSSNMQEFWRQVKKFGYHRQAAVYSLGFLAMHGVWPTVSWVIVQSSPPFECWVRNVPDKLISLGLRDVKQTLVRLRECREGKRPWVSEDSLVEHDLEVPDHFLEEYGYGQNS